MSDFTSGSTPGVTGTEPLQEAASFAKDPDEGMRDYAAYRPAGANRLDIDPRQHEKMQVLALNLWRRNPLAHRICKMVAGFAVGGNVKFEAENPKIQQILVEHWEHPLNDWERQYYQCTLELGIYGELFMLANVMDDGSVTWGHIDPLRVPKLIPDEVNLSVPAKAVLKMPARPGDASPHADLLLDVISYDGAAKSDTHGYRVGEVLFTRTNGVRGSLRGLSDLYPLVDYLEGLDQFMFALQQRVGHQNNWIWDVTLEGMSEVEIREWMNGLHGQAPQPGALRVHNERVEWQAVAPEFSGEDATDHVRLFRNYMLAGAGIADWMIGDMGSANRAATENSSAVIAKMMEQRQREAKRMLEDVFNFVIDQKILKGTLPQVRKFNREFFITMPKIGIRDFQRVAGSLRQGAEGINKLLEAGLISEDRAIRVSDELLNQLDIEGGDRFRDPVDVEEIKREREARKTKDMNRELKKQEKSAEISAKHVVKSEAPTKPKAVSNGTDPAKKKEKKNASAGGSTN